MKKGFTLVEMLIVVVIIVTLMTMTFRLSSIGGSTSYRNMTVARLQKIENCLSGYYAAFGTYPPVRLHGSRNYKLRVSSHGIQNVDGEEEELNWSWFNNGKVSNSKKEADDWQKVRAACKSQPVDCRFPFPEDGGYDELVQAVSQEMAAGAKDADSLTDREKAVIQAGFDDGVTQNIGRHAGNRGKSEWREIQLFKFGLMSFLLPRYLVMMDSAPTLYRNYEQWNGNNSLPSDPLTGQKFSDWSQLRNYTINADKNPSDMAHVANIPSQAVCARWMPNLAGICYGNRKTTLFGVQVCDGETYGDLKPDNFDIEVYSPGGFESDSTSSQYVLDGLTVKDGWAREFYYYSPAPYQSYVLWSAGANGRTFPPWVSRRELNSAANECVGYWTEDDIVNLSH